MTAATAREWVTAAAKLQALPKISDALSQGKLSFDQVKPLVEVARPETDATLAEQATRWSAKQVRELAIAARAIQLGRNVKDKPAQQYVLFEDAAARAKEQADCLLALLATQELGRRFRIPEAEQGKIWDRLYRGDKSRSQRGLGLGLSVVRAVVQAHHGTVTVQSKPGEGSEFSIVLPAT